MHRKKRPLISSIAVAGAVVAVVAATFGAASSSAAKAPPPLTLYSVATAEQFVNNADDRQRGKGNNPFGNFHDATATTREKGNGPFPGDEALFKFNVYKTGALKGVAGTAVFTCEYNFSRQAFCNVSYQLAGGTLIGEGPFDFNASTFSIAITGGTKVYRGVRGDLNSSPGPKHSEHLVFEFVD
jgi:hypothetical protein